MTPTWMPLSPLAPAVPGCPRAPASPCGSCQNYDSLILKKTKSDIKPTATNNCELTLSPGGPLGPGGPSSLWRSWRREKGKQEDPIKCHICIWKTKPAISQAAHVFSRVKWIFFVGRDKATLPSGRASRENRRFHALPWGPLQIQDFHLDVIKKKEN